MYPNQQPWATGQFPAGWRPPYNGAPPLPQGMNVNVQEWQNGRWAYNAQFKGALPQNTVHVPWIPGPWPQNQKQQQEQANPYQRPHKPPSAAYLSMPVKCNALDLFGMVPRAQVYTDSPDVPHTPWIWNPRGLVEEGQEEGIIQADFRDIHGQTITRESRGATPTRRPSVNRSPSPSPSPLDQRRRSRDQPDSTRQASEPSHQQRQIYAPLEGSDKPTLTRRQTEPPMRHEFEHDDAPLRPTFSSSIICTPDHYRDSPARKRRPSASRSSSTDTPSHNQGRHPIPDADLASKLTTSRRRQSSLSTHGAPPFEESNPVLSPLLLPEPAGSRPLGRHHTYPMLSSIPESSTSSSLTVSASPGTLSRAASPSSSPSSHASSPRRHTPTSASPRNFNPLPTPPRDITYNLAPLGPHLSPTQPRKKVRIGWYNQRGDHLTDDGHIVYAPTELANPSELAQYPKQDVAWMNEKGQTIKHSSQWVELEESLPRLGRLPIKPYSSFVRYIEVPPPAVDDIISLYNPN